MPPTTMITAMAKPVRMATVGDISPASAAESTAAFMLSRAFSS